MPRFLAVLTLIGAALTACASETTDTAPGASTGDAVQRLDSTQVPADLRHLVPLAERWGIGDDVDRAAQVDQSTAAEREELRAALLPYQAQITAWLDSFGQGVMSDEAAAFMYMQLAVEEMAVAPQRQSD